MKCIDLNQRGILTKIIIWLTLNGKRKGETMRLKKIFIVFNLMIATVVLSACSTLSGGIFIKDYDKSGEEHFMEIKVALENYDNDKLKSLFSSQALSEVNDIDDGIRSILDIPWENVSFQNNGFQTSESSSYGKKEVVLQGKYTVTTGVDSYVVFFDDHVVDTEHPEKIGIYMIQIINESNIKNWGTLYSRAGAYLN